MCPVEDPSWFSLARQPQEPLSPGGITLVGADLARWKRGFRPLLRYLKRKDVVLALSGGGMAMPCHVSVLRLLELLAIEPRRIYGTSAGAVIGGLYAAGMGTTDLESAMRDIKSADELFGFAARHPALRLVTAAVRRGFARPSLAETGIYSLNRVEDYVERTITKYLGRVPTMGELEVPFSCVALDIGTGRPADGDRDVVKKVVFSGETTPDLPLSDALGASMSIPGVLTPKKLADRYHIDGATIEHVPIATAHGDWRERKRRFGRRLAIIAVDLGYGGETMPEESLVDPVGLLMYSGRLQERALTYHNLFQYHRPRRGSSVILVRPEIPHTELHEVEKIPRLLYAAYESAVGQLSGPDFLSGTEEALGKAGTLLGLPRSPV